MTTTYSNHFHAVPQRETALAATPQQPQPQPIILPAGAAAGPLQPESQGTPGNGSAAATSARIVEGITLGGQFDLVAHGKALNLPEAAPEQKEESRRLVSWTGGKRQLVMKNASTIEPEPIDWLWTGWLAKGFINIVAGETGAGKSTVLADVVARVTTGAPWPDEENARKPGQVLWLGSEDPPELMTVPRLMAMKANLEHVNFVQGVNRDGKSLAVSLQDDVGSMMDALMIAVRQGEPISMIVIDPVTSYLSGGVLKKVDINDAGQIRTVLEPWSKIAEAFNVAVVCVTHFAKDTNRAMLHRVLGTGAFTALGRSTIAITKLPEAAQNGDPHAKAMFQVKTNLTEQPEGAWRFTTLRTTIFNKANRAISATKVDWGEVDSSLTPESLVGGQRGPVSHYGVTFPIWLKAQFLATPPTQGLPVAPLKAKAIADGAATERWWNEHSNQYLDKKNFGGNWYCRPRMA